MPLPRSVAHFNKRVTNRILAPLVLHLPTFGVVIHTGRKTHRQYRTPINIFKRDGKYVIGLTYGPNSDWVRNVLANDGCIVEIRGRTLRLSQPSLVHDESRRSWPAPVRFILGLAHVYDFLELTPEGAAKEASAN